MSPLPMIRMTGPRFLLPAPVGDDSDEYIQGTNQRILFDVGRLGCRILLRAE